MSFRYGTGTPCRTEIHMGYKSKNLSFILCFLALVVFLNISNPYFKRRPPPVPFPNPRLTILRHIPIQHDLVSLCNFLSWRNVVKQYTTHPSTNYGQQWFSDFKYRRTISNVVSQDRYRVCNTVQYKWQWLAPVITVRSNIFTRSIKTEAFIWYHYRRDNRVHKKHWQLTFWHRSFTFKF